MALSCWDKAARAYRAGSLFLGAIVLLPRGGRLKGWEAGLRQAPMQSREPIAYVLSNTVTLTVLAAPDEAPA